MGVCSRSGGGCCTPALSRPSKRLAPDRRGRAGRTPGAPCPAGRGVGQGRDLLPAGGGEGHWHGRPTARRWRPSSRRSAPSRICRSTRDTREQAIDLRLALRTALRPSGRLWAHPGVPARGRGPCGGPRRPASAGTGLALSVTLLSASWATYDQAIAAGQRALALATASGDGVLQALANQFLGAAYHAQGDYRRAIDCLQADGRGPRGRAAPERFGQVYLPAVLSRAWLPGAMPSWAYSPRAGPSEKKGSGLPRRCASHEPHAGLARGSVCWPSPRRPAQGTPLARTGRGHLSGGGPPSLFPWVAAALGAAYTLAGRVADALPLLTQALEQTMTTEMV